MKTRFFSLLFLFGCSLASKAQFPAGGNNGMMSPQMQNMPSGTTSSKKEEPPHGGEIKEAGKYNIEVVFDAFSSDEKLNVWLLKNSNLKPAKIDKATGKVTIKYPKLEKEETKDLILSDDRFYCNVSEPSTTFTAFITITLKNKEYKVVYNQKALGGG